MASTYTKLRLGFVHVKAASSLSAQACCITGLSNGNAVGYGNASYLVSPPSTQYLTLGNGGIIQYGDGVTLESPKAYNNFSSVV